MMQRFFGVSALLCSLAFLALLAFSWVKAPDLFARERYGHELRRVRSADGRLDKLVLEARLGLLGHYDPLIIAQREIQSSLEKLADPPAYLGEARRENLQQDAERARALFEQKRDVLERIKTQHAAFRNSARYFPAAVTALLDQGPPDDVRAAANALFGSVSKFLLSAESYLAEQTIGHMATLKHAMDELDDPRVKQAANHVLLHAELLLAKKPVLDHLIEQLLSLPMGHTLDLLDARHGAHHEAALADARARRLWLFVLALMSLMSGAGYVLARLRRSANQLADALSRLEKANELLREERMKEREIHELKSRFAARTSHEFRTPLSIIMSSSELLANYGPRLSEEKRDEHRARIEGAVRDMTEMLDEILAAWREDGGERSFQPEDVDVRELSQACVSQVAEAMATAERVVVRCHGQDLHAELDVRLTRHILTNLVSNAIKYSPAHERVVVDVRKLDGHIVMTVTDRGMGIPEEDQVHLFEDFHRGSNVEDIPGTGLGLAVARRAAEIHGGTISVTSRVGEGSSFVVRLPVKAQRPRTAESAGAQP